MTENWRAIPGFEGLYEVSDLGRVRSLDREVFVSSGARGAGSYVSRRKGKTLRQGRSKSGHLTVVLGRTAGSRTVHSLVAAAFIGPYPSPKHEIRHFDGDPSHNALANIEYSTHSRNGLDKKWHAGAIGYRLRPADVARIKSELGPFGAGARLARQFGVAQSTISAIKNDRFHRDVVA